MNPSIGPLPWIDVPATVVTGLPGAYIQSKDLLLLPKPVRRTDFTYLGDLMPFLLEVQLERHGFCGIGGIGGLLVLRASLITPTEADVWRLSIPTEAAR